MLIPSKEQVEQRISDIAPTYGLDVEIVMKQCHAESAFDQRARSWCGAVGLMQLMPSTAMDLRVDPYDWKENLDGGMRYLARMLRAFAGDYAKALAAYNWGAGHVKNCVAAHGDAWRQHLPKETSGYLTKILG